MITSRVIGPSEAKKILENQVENNRGVSLPVVKRLAGAMTRGEWVENGETLKFNKKKKLFDGQHRLHAVILSNTKQKFLCVEGLNDGVMTTIDVGKPRSLNDHLTIAGEHNVACKAGAVRLLGQLKFHEEYSEHGNNTGIATTEYLMKVFSQYRELLNEHAAAYHEAKQVLRPSEALFIQMILTSCMPRKAAVFLDKLYHGEDLKKNEPLYQCRNWLLENRIRWTKRSKVRVHKSIIVNTVFKTWNLYCNGSKSLDIVWARYDEDAVIPKGLPKHFTEQ